jgi:hypothetical protein
MTNRPAAPRVTTARANEAPGKAALQRVSVESLPRPVLPDVARSVTGVIRWGG